MIEFKRADICKPGMPLHDEIAREQGREDGTTRYTPAEWAVMAERIFRVKPAWLKWAETKMKAPIVRFAIDWATFLRTSKRDGSLWLDLDRLHYFARTRGFEVRLKRLTTLGSNPGESYRIRVEQQTIKITVVTTRRK